jgi:hypothetical protein
MGRFCYCSKVLPGKSATVKLHWKNKEASKDTSTKKNEALFWNHLKMTGFESWLQPTPHGDFIIHCLEGESLEQIFKGLREQIASGNPIAVNLRNFYLDVLGKDYAQPESQPQIEHLLDISLPEKSAPLNKRGFIFPLLAHQEEAHRRFRKEAMGEKRGRHEASIKAFGVTLMSSWLQNIQGEKYIIVYTEGALRSPNISTVRLQPGESSPAWKEVSEALMSHTGLKAHELSPEVEWLTN